MTEYQNLVQQELAEFAKAVKSPISFSKAVLFHYQSIRRVNDKGFTIPFIKEALKLDQSVETFRTALVRAKKQIEKQQKTKALPVTQTISQSPLQETQPTSSKNEVNDSENISEDLKQRWIKAFGFTLSDTFLPLAIAELTQYGWTPDNYYKLNEKHNLFNAKSLRRILSSISSHKATNKEYNS
ncbi:hypothetical protein ACP6H1_27350 [Vibrio harveyi]|uniref:hypothetical protein n=1 Tax=Vibrio harveyi TaxID=669 RepID=UPI003CF9FA4C